MFLSSHHLKVGIMVRDGTVQRKDFLENFIGKFSFLYHLNTKKYQTLT